MGHVNVQSEFGQIDSSRGDMIDGGGVEDVEMGVSSTIAAEMFITPLCKYY